MLGELILFHRALIQNSLNFLNPKTKLLFTFSTFDHFKIQPPFFNHFFYFIVEFRQGDRIKKIYC